ncbi:MAG: Glycosyltransferase [candidate division Zixibacteria bacterium RBG-1]|nr:MAG: Glycosyltransferase [candidate division Zixibacteria bacterium RBG-1]OGC83752.1 MAG: hypothetical protein A2V73_02260 [candidate division Zixibacteria bacterium RBG_19FT_COMBO_42_43]
MEDKKYTQLFWLTSSAFLFFRLIYINLIPLAPQEAYYWNYSQHLALSYFDHPPLQAWLIFLTTKLWVSEFTVRLACPILAFLSGLFCFKIGKLLFNAKIGFYFFLVLNSILIFNIGSVIFTPDALLLFFWILSFYFFRKIIVEDKSNYWYGLGISLGLAMLSKYTAIFIPISVSAFLLFSPLHRFWFKRREPYLAVLLSLLVFSPVLIWNAQTHWASFGFQTTRRMGELVSFSLRDFFAYLGSQMGLVSPLIYAGIIYAVVKIGKEGFKNKDSVSLALFFWSAPILVFFTLVSFNYWIKINWVAPGYVTAILALVVIYFKKVEVKSLTGWSSQKSFKIWGLTSVVISFIFSVLGYLAPILPLGINAGEALAEWKELARKIEQVKQEMNEKGEPIIIGYEYKTASELAFYLPGRPEVYSNNFVGRPGLAYDFWANPADFKGRNAIFVYDQRNRYKTPENLRKLFKKVDIPVRFSVYKRGGKITEFYIFRCFGYKGIFNLKN